MAEKASRSGEEIVSEFDELFGSSSEQQSPQASADAAEFEQLFGTGEHSARVHESLLGAEGTNPDEQATRRKLAAELNTPVALLPPTAEAQAELVRRNNRPDEIAAKSPGVAKWLQNVDNGKLIGGDARSLRVIEDTVRKTKPKPTVGNIVSGIGTSIKEQAQQSMIGLQIGAEQRKEQALPLADKEFEKVRLERIRIQQDIDAGLLVPKFIPQDYGSFKTQYIDDEGNVKATTDDSGNLIGLDEAVFNAMGPRSPVGKIGRARRAEMASLLGDWAASQERVSAATPEFETQAGRVLYQGAAGAAGSLPQMALSIALPEAAPLIWGMPTYAAAKAKYLARGATDQEAEIGSAIEAASAVITNQFTLGYVTKAFSNANIPLKEFLANTIGREIPSEMADTLVSSITDTAIANPDKTWGELMQELPEELAIAATGAILMSGTLGGAHAAATSAVKRVAQARERKALQDQLIQLRDRVAEEPLRERDPAAFHEFIRGLDDGSTINELYLPAEELQAIAQSPGGKELLAKMPDVQAQLAEATAMGADVAISVADYATHIAGTDMDNRLLSKIKAEPGGMTAEESDAFMQTEAKAMQEEAQRISNEEVVLSREDFEQMREQQAQAAKPAERRQAPRRTAGENNAPVLSKEFGEALEFAEKTRAESKQLRERGPERRAEQRRTDNKTRAMLEQAQASGEYTEEQVQKLLELARLSPNQIREELGAARLEAELAPPEKAAAAQAKIKRLEQKLVDHQAQVEAALQETPEQKAAKGKRKAKETAATYEQYLANHPNQKAVRILDAEQTGKQIEADLAAVNRFNKDLTRVYARHILSFYAQQAERMNVLPSELWAKHRIRFSTTEYAGLNQNLRGLPSTVMVDGKPVEFNAFEPARAAAAQYMASAGLPYTPITQYVKVNQDRARRIAAEFDKMKHDPNNPEVKAAYEAMVKETLAQWQFVKKAGLKVDFITGEDPYGNPRNAILDIVNNNHMWVYPTDAGYGKVGAEMEKGNPMLAIVEGETISGKPVRVNDIFRIVHDYFGHVKEGVGFRADGEENAWRIHSSMFSPLARRALTTETRGQNSWLNFGPHGERNRTAKTEDTVFAEQKIGLLPEWVSNEGAADALTVRGVHFSKQRREVLSGKHAGTGLPGAESKRLKYATDPRLKSRVYFYVDEGQGVRPEQGLGQQVHEATLENMYDATANPLGLDRKDLNDFESAVLDAGYSGYYVRGAFNKQGGAVVLGDSAVEIKPDSRRVPIEEIVKEIEATGRQPIPADVIEEVAGGATQFEVKEVALDSVRSDVAPAKQETVEKLTKEAQRTPIVLGANGVLIDGRHRLAAAKARGDKTIRAYVPVQEYGQKAKKTELNPDVVKALGKVIQHLTPQERAKLRRDTAKKLVKTFKALPDTDEMAAVAYAGRAKRGWYARSADAISNVFGPDAPRFAGLLAAMSPQTSVETNLRNALKTWANWVNAGRPQTREEIVQIMGLSVEGSKLTESVLPAWINNSVRSLTAEDPSTITLSGPKVNSFMLNLRGVVDEVTNDSWMSNYALVDQEIFKGALNVAGDEPGKGPGYLAMSARVRAAAKRLTELTGEEWTPAEVQETVWSWAKTLYEMQVKGMGATDILMEEKLTHELIAATPDFRSLLTEDSNAETLTAAGYGERLDRLRSGAGTEATGEEPKVGQPVAKTAPFDEATQLAFELDAARRLEKLSEQREAAYQQSHIGSFNPATMTMSFLKGADLSTPLHESGHAFLELMAKFASEKASPEIELDFEKVMQWFGTTADQWNSMTLDEKRPFHEQWAESYELYLLENKAPSAELRPLFERFSAWLTTVYKSIKDFLATHPAAGKLNDEIRGVFDRMLAAQDSIAAIEQERGYEAMFAATKISPQQQQQLAVLHQDATNSALSDMQHRSLRDMKWLSNAKSKRMRALQATAKDTRAVIRAEVEAEVKREPVYELQLALRNREGDLKIHTGELRALLPDLDVRLLSGMTSEKNGTHPEQIADIFGFPSAIQMVNELLAAENMQEKIDGLTDIRMLSEHGDLVDPRSIEQAANAAVHNEARARFMATGLKMLTKIGSVRNLVRAAKQAAYNAISNKQIRDLRPGQYDAAETRANKEVLKLAPKSPAKAIIAQRQALLSNRMAKETRVALDEVEAGLAYLKRLQSEGAKKSIDLAEREQIDRLLRPFDMSMGLSAKEIDARAALVEWIQRMEDKGFEPAFDDAALEKILSKPYKTMTMSEFRGLIEAVKQIEHLGRMKKKLLTAKEKADLDARVEEATASIIDNANRTVKEHPAPTDIAGLAGKWWRQMLAAHRKFASLIREMDGGQDNGVMANLMLYTMNDAGNNEVNMRSAAADKLAELFKPIQKELGSSRLWSRKRPVPGTEISMTKEQQLMFALNWGTEGNRQRLIDGGLSGHRQLSQGEAQKIIESLTKQDWDFVQSVWDYLATFRPLIAKQERALTGVEPEWIPAAPIDTPHGQYRGGYFPAKYDADLSTRSESLEAVTNLRQAMSGAFGRSSARSGYTKKRAAEVVGRPLLLSFNTISQHVSEVTHRLAWQEWLIDANRLLKRLDSPIREHYGAENLREMRQLVRDIAAGDAPSTTPVERAINHIRIGSTVVGMGWRFSTALLQPTGLAQSWVRIGGPAMARGIGRFMAHPRDSLKFIKERSPMMRERAKTMQREINEVLNVVRAGEKVSAVQGSYFTMIHKMQQMVDAPTWLGAYEKALGELQLETALNDKQRQELEDKAIKIADQAVLDSQGAGTIKDMAAVQRGSPIFKLFTNFYSYFNTTYNLNAEAFRKAKLTPSSLAMLAVDLLIVNAVPTIFALALHELLKNKCEWDTECLAKQLSVDQVNNLLGQMILLREAGSAVNAAAGEGFGYSGPAGLRFFSDLYKFGQQASQGEMDMNTFKAANQVGGALLHYPAGQINSTLEGIMAIEDGDVEGVNIFSALMAGPPK